MLHFCYLSEIRIHSKKDKQLKPLHTASYDSKLQTGGKKKGFDNVQPDKRNAQKENTLTWSFIKQKKRFLFLLFRTRL